MQRLISAGILCLFGVLAAPSAARATFHFYDIQEVFSNSDGSVQFVELFTTFDGQQFVNGQRIVASQDGSSNTFTFVGNGPTPTGDRHLLIATATFEAACGIVPDYILPDNFLFDPDGTVNFVSANTVSYTTLPLDGKTSLSFPGETTGTNSPKNHAGDTCSIEAPAQGPSGSFTVVSYNVAALPPIVACCDPGNSIPEIAGRISPDDFDLVLYQEAFVHGFDDGQNFFGSLYYDTLMGDSTPAAYQFPPADVPTGGVQSVASGLGRVSTLSSDSSGTLFACEAAENDDSKFCRQKWDSLTSEDALSDKGYSFGPHMIAEGAYVDVYNLHAQAGGSNATERADNIQQLIDEINLRSEGRADIVMGDTNSTYDRVSDVIRLMLTDTTGNSGEDDPLEDVWLELVRSELGIPAQGGTPLFPCDESGDPAEMPRTEWAGPNCEWRDKIFYRKSDGLVPAGKQYFVVTDYTNTAGADLSDHYPTGAVFD